MALTEILSLLATDPAALLAILDTLPDWVKWVVKPFPPYGA